jgi:hypothetical protein
MRRAERIVDVLVSLMVFDFLHCRTSMICVEHRGEVRRQRRGGGGGERAFRRTAASALEQTQCHATGALLKRVRNHSEPD